MPSSEPGSNTAPTGASATMARTRGSASEDVSTGGGSARSSSGRRRVFCAMRLAVGAQARHVETAAGQREHGVSAGRVAERADARPARVPGDAVAPLRIAKQRVEHARDVSRPLGEIRRRPARDEAVVLPVVAGVAQRGDEIAAAREGLGEAFVNELGAAQAVADDDEALERRVGRSLRRHVREERTQGDGALRGLRRVVQDTGSVLAHRQPRHRDLAPACLRGEGGRRRERAGRPARSRRWSEGSGAWGTPAAIFRRGFSLGLPRRPARPRRRTAKAARQSTFRTDGSRSAESPPGIREDAPLRAASHRRVAAAPSIDAMRRVSMAAARVADARAHGLLDNDLMGETQGRQRGVEDLRQSEERFRLLVESVRDYAIFMLDPAGHVLTWNAGAERFKGYRADEIIGQHFSRFYPPEALARGLPEHELEVAARGRRLRGRRLARPQGRLAVLGQRRHHGDARRGRRAARLRQGHARPDRSGAATKRRCARARSVSACSWRA